MAQRRMFSLQVVDTDRFLEMPASAQLLYFHLGMRADDDGFVSSPKRIARYMRCREKDLQLLAERGWILPFSSGVVAITDWKLNNAIRADRYQETIHLREKEMLRVGQDKRYVLQEPDGCREDNRDGCRDGCQDGSQTGDISEPQDRLGKDREGKNSAVQNRTEKISIEKNRQRESGLTPTRAKAAKETYGEYGWVKLTDVEYLRLLTELGAQELEQCIAYVDAAAQSTGNQRGWRDWSTVIRQCSWENWGKNASLSGSRPL